MILNVRLIKLVYHCWIWSKGHFFICAKISRLVAGNSLDAFAFQGSRTSPESV